MDVEGIAYVSAKVTALRGLMSLSTYQRIKDTLNNVQGELNSAKSMCGALMADVETLRAERDAALAKAAALQSELESLSIKTVDAAVEKLVETPAVAEVIAAVETPGVAESVPKESIAG